VPGNTEELLQRAHAEHAAGRLADAEKLVQTVLASDARQPQAHLLMGVVAGKTGRDDLALSHLDRALDESPGLFEALFWKSILWRRKGKLEEAEWFARRATEARPGDVFALNNLGLVFMERSRFEEAAESFQQVTRLRPDMEPAFHNLGTCLFLLGKDQDAARAFERSIQLAPRNVDSYLGLGQTMLVQSRSPDAIEVATRALEIDPRSARAHLLIANGLAEESRTAEAQKHLDRALQLDPNDAAAHAILGMRYQSLGQFEDANRHVLKSIELEPKQGFAYFAYAYNNRIEDKDRPLVEKMALLRDESVLGPREQNFLNYALGRCYESLGDYEKSMRALDEANALAKRLRFSGREFDRDAYRGEFDRLIQLYDREAVSAGIEPGADAPTPIVVVGMMRSGTTLVEQILSSHPEVAAAGEQRFWPRNRPSLMRKKASATLPALGREYVATLRRFGPASRFVTDKMPSNYELLGPIHLAVPQAKIIHMRRNPADTAISIYATPNRSAIEYAHDRSNIVFAYREYQRLMAHWRSVLPAESFLEVDYEELVSSREQVIRRILEFLDLGWNDALLEHEKNQRNVLTPSLWQVRQPMYSSSIGRWKRFEPWLGEFATLV
jgi:tetratricopeptide (TPR) repeat protein